MITTRARILSILATVAMLVSMLACFVVPASAASADDTYAVNETIAWNIVLRSIQDYQNAVPNSVAAWQALNAGTGNVEAVEEIVATEVAPEIGNTIHWNEFTWDATKTQTRFPKYEYREQFKAAGYTANVWSITDPGDWYMMVKDSENNETFAGATFHVTQNINFNSVRMDPLNFTSAEKSADMTYTFKGTIEGHGNAFENVYLKFAATADDATAATGNSFVGIIGTMGEGAIIRNFGVNSGTILGTVRNMDISTFGAAKKTEHVTLQNVWSGVDLTANTAGGSAVCGILANPNNTYTVINGAYFFGSLSGDFTATGLDYFALAGNNTNYCSFYNTIGAPKTGSSIDYSIRWTNGTTLHVANNFSVGYDNVYGYTEAAKIENIDNTNVKVDTVEEAAYKVNIAQNNEQTFDKVYFTKTQNGIRPTDVEANRIVKLTVYGVEKYINNGTQVTKAEMAGMLDVGEEAIIVGDVTGGTYDAETGKLTVNGDTTVAVTVNKDALLQNAWNPYKDMETKYLAADAATAYEAAEAAYEAAAKGEADIDAAIATINGLGSQLVTYSTYPVTDEGKAVPGYKDAELYGAYNTAKVWTINTTDDWLKMVDASKDGEKFEGTNFHVTQNINFNDVPMDPLNFDGAVASKNMTIPFQGIIDGHGNAFENIKIQFVAEGNEGTIANKDSFAGIIGSMGEGAIIRNFGVDSGTITTTVEMMDIGTFGHVLATQNVTLKNVWSGVDLTADTSAGSAVCGILANPNNSYAVVNGAYFFGSLSGNVETGLDYFTLAGNNMNYCSFYNTIGAPKTGSKVDYSVRWTSGAGVNVANNFSVGYDNVYGWNTAKEGIDNTNVKAETAGEAAYKVNIAQNNEQTFDKVYFTKTQNGIRPNGTYDDRIVKYAVTINNAEPVNYYENVGTAVDLKAVLNLPEAAVIDSVTIGEGAIPADGNGKYAITGDVAVVVTVDQKGQLQAKLADKLAEYTGLNVNYFKGETELEDGQMGLAEFMPLATSDVTADLEAAVAAIENETLVVEITEIHTNTPAYKEHTTYGKYQPATGANWLIVDAADWKAMDAFANDQTQAGDYFADTTFHLVDDVDFNKEPMLPLGIQTANKMTFAGTIDGHGYGFKRVTIDTTNEATPLTGTSFMADDDKIRESIGLIGFLGDGCTIQNFGVNSADIKNVSGAAGVSVSTFGTIDGTTVNFTNVWSGARLLGSGTRVFANALAGIAASETSKVNVNGFTFYGIAETEVLAFGIMGGASKPVATPSTFKNIITYPSNPNEKDTFLLGTGLSDLTGYTISNVYGVGITYDYRATTSGGNDVALNTWVTTMTAEEAAYELNTTKNDGVYFKIASDGGIRPTDSATNKIVKVTVAGIEKDPIYINANQGYSKTDVAKILGMNAADISTIAVDNGTYAADVLTVTADATITVTENVCEHPAESYVYEKTTEGKHKILCGLCGALVDNQESCDGVASYHADLNGSVIDVYIAKTECSKCHETAKIPCREATFVDNTEDCTQAEKYIVNCHDEHAGTYEIEGTKQDTHAFPEGWTNDENVANKQYKKCANCETKMYKYEGELQGGTISLKARADGEYVIELPANLASATLTFAMTGDYTYEVTEGATLVEGDVYTVAGATQVTVKVTAAVTANGGKLTVAMTGAKATAEAGSVGDIVITDATAEIAITHSKVDYDANGDNTVNLQDALAALYVYVERPGAADINVANVDTINVNGTVEIEEVYAIVKYWLSDIVGKV